MYSTTTNNVYTYVLTLYCNTFLPTRFYQRFAGLGTLVTCFFPWHPTPEKIRAKLGLDNAMTAFVIKTPDSKEEQEEAEDKAEPLLMANGEEGAA